MATSVVTPAQAQDIRRRIARDPAWFFRHILGERMVYPKQIELMEAVRDHRRVACVAGNSTGKDWTSGRLVLWWLSSRYPAKVVVMAPTFAQISSIVWKETRLAWENARPPLGGHMLESPRWQFDDQHFAIGLSTDNPHNLQGFHSPNLFVIISEAHGMDQADIEAAKRLNPTRMLLTGNPLSLVGEFHDAFYQHADLYHGIHISAFDTPNITAGQVVIPGMVTREDIEERARDWGKDSPMYRASILGEFPDSLEDSLIQRTWVDTAVGRRFPQPVDEAGISRPHHPIILGVDVARFGADKSVAVRRDGPLVQLVFRLQGHDTMDVSGRIRAYLEANPEVEGVVIDDDGVGGGVTDRLRELGVNVGRFQNGAKAVLRDRYQNQAAEAWSALAKALQAGQVSLPNDGALLGQLASRRYRIQSDKRLALEPKDEIKRRGGNSPDEADALAMTFWPRALEFAIGPPTVAPRASQWQDQEAPDEFFGRPEPSAPRPSLWR